MAQQNYDQRCMRWERRKPHYVHLIEIRCQKKSDERGEEAARRFFFCKSSIPERTCIGNFQEYIDDLGVWEDSKDFNAFFLCTGLHPN